MSIHIYKALLNIPNRKMRSKKELLEDVMIAIERKAKSSPKVKSLIKLDGDDFSVDWKKVAECQQAIANQDSFVSTVLLELGTLSWDSKGNYALVQYGEDRNPYCAPKSYFSKKQDALEYKEALMSEAISDEEKLDLRVFPIKLVQYLD